MKTFANLISTAVALSALHSVNAKAVSVRNPVPAERFSLTLSPQRSRSEISSSPTATDSDTASASATASGIVGISTTDSPALTSTTTDIFPTDTGGYVDTTDTSFPTTTLATSASALPSLSLPVNSGSASPTSSASASSAESSGPILSLSDTPVPSGVNPGGPISVRTLSHHSPPQHLIISQTSDSGSGSNDPTILGSSSSRASQPDDSEAVFTTCLVFLPTDTVTATTTDTETGTPTSTVFSFPPTNSASASATASGTASAFSSDAPSAVPSDGF
ncbi:hypothetical protein B0H17DRAFT_1186417 [Mycena rosella]|uniref:Uncharacterized protein n=1 Tax=Mycena rosella TaxID=1033263 RepID=A0AAD7CM71_MYCRO|nr:hypothetical protein B0H17DRAFT_1186417 [Mycena rosella]